MRLLSPSAVTADDLDAWNRLGECAIEANPFAEAAFVPTAVRALGAEHVQLLVAERDGEWIGCLPIEIRRVIGFPILASTWSHPYSFLGTPLVARDRIAEFAAELAASLRAAEHCRFLLLRTCGDGPVLAALEAAAAEAGLAPIFARRFERGAYEGRDEEEELNWMKSRHSKLRRARRKLEKDLDQEVVARETEAEAANVDAFLALESAGWKGEQGTSFLSHEKDAAFARAAYAPGLAALDSLLLDGKPIAMKLSIRTGRTAYTPKIAYDEAFKKLGPGMALEYLLIEAFYASETLDGVDAAATAEGHSALNFFNNHKAMGTVIVGRRGWQVSVLAALHEGRKVVKERVKAWRARGVKPAG